MAEAVRRMDCEALRASGLMIGQDRQQSMEPALRRAGLQPTRPLRPAQR